MNRIASLSITVLFVAFLAGCPSGGVKPGGNKTISRIVGDLGYTVTRPPSQLMQPGSDVSLKAKITEQIAPALAAKYSREGCDSVKGEKLLFGIVDDSNPAD